MGAPMKNLRTASRILWTLGAVFLAAPADAVSPPYTQVSCHGSGGPIDLGPLDQSLSCDNYADPSLGYIAAGANLPGTAAFAKGTGYGIISPGGSPYISGASSSVHYYFLITAPVDADPTLLVPVVADVYLFASVTGGGHVNHDVAYAEAVIDQSAPHAAGVFASVESGYSSSNQDLFDSSFVDDVPPNVENSMVVDARITLNSDAGAEPDVAYAYADPYLRIDPTFLATHPGYSLALSDGISNAEPVPEPAEEWMPGVALLGLGGLAWRRRVH
jgi:MYXO-CTERM domain-containing protein